MYLGWWRLQGPAQASVQVRRWAGAERLRMSSMSAPADSLSVNGYAAAVCCTGPKPQPLGLIGFRSSCMASRWGQVRCSAR